jgi:hypothetical protein
MNPIAWNSDLFIERVSGFRSYLLLALAGFALGVLCLWVAIAVANFRYVEHSVLSQHRLQTAEPSILTCILGLALWVYLLGAVHGRIKTVVLIFSIFGGMLLIGLVRDLVMLSA